jgi:hypothetical protein
MDTLINYLLTVVYCLGAGYQMRAIMEYFWDNPKKKTVHNAVVLFLAALFLWWLMELIVSYRSYKEKK